MHANDKAFILGLTGGIACGKSTIATKLATLGAIHLDADAISHSVIAAGGEAVDAIRERFGEGAVLPDGSIDRKRLGAIVFSDPSARRVLEGIIHPMVQRHMIEAIDDAPGGSVVVMDVPLLFETGMDAMCHEVWAVVADRQTQIERLQQRNGFSPEEAALRIDSQMSAEVKAARANAVIHTARPLERTLADVSNMYASLLRRIKE